MKNINDKMTLREFEVYVKLFFYRIFSIQEPVTEANFDEWLDILKNVSKGKHK